MSELLNIQNLHLHYQGEYTNLHALNGIDLNLKTGQSLGLVGESGCGKSTLAHAIMGLLPSSVVVNQGQVSFQGETIFPKNKSTPFRGTQIGMIFQDPMTSLNPFLSIEAQMIEGLRFHKHYSKKEALKKALEWLERVRIPDAKRVLKRYPHECSGGMSQRIMIAMVLSLEPELLVADEPTTALDVSTQATVLEILRSAQQERGMAMIFVSHDIGVVADVCQDMAVMYAGQIIESGSIKKVIDSPRHPYTKNLLASRPPLHGELPEALPSLAGIPPKLNHSPLACPLAPRCPQSSDLCFQQPAPFQDDDQHFVQCHHLTS
jgi:oligopeptide/dipeptide ABC transporter ATP-binding protein